MFANFAFLIEFFKNKHPFCSELKLKKCAESKNNVNYIWKGFYMITYIMIFGTLGFLKLIFAFLIDFFCLKIR